MPVASNRNDQSRQPELHMSVLEKMWWIASKLRCDTCQEDPCSNSISVERSSVMSVAGSKAGSLQQRPKTTPILDWSECVSPPSVEVNKFHKRLLSDAVISSCTSPSDAAAARDWSGRSRLFQQPCRDSIEGVHTITSDDADVP